MCKSNMEIDFLRRKPTIIRNLSEDFEHAAFVSIICRGARNKSEVHVKHDCSPKGSVDNRCWPILRVLNLTPCKNCPMGDYVTTSSCSGRIALWRGVEKGKGTWLFTSHDSVPLDKISPTIANVDSRDEHNLDNEQVSPPVGSLWNILQEGTQQDRTTNVAWTFLKFEPFVAHVQCRTIEAGKLLLSSALQCGYRHSGLLLGKKRIICTIRQSTSIDTPLAKGHNIFISKIGLINIVEMLNFRLEDNHRRVESLLDELKCMMA